MECTVMNSASERDSDSSLSGSDDLPDIDQLMPSSDIDRSFGSIGLSPPRSSMKIQYNHTLSSILGKRRRSRDTTQLLLEAEKSLADAQHAARRVSGTTSLEVSADDTIFASLARGKELKSVLQTFGAFSNEKRCFIFQRRLRHREMHREIHREIHRVPNHIVSKTPALHQFMISNTANLDANTAVIALLALSPTELAHNITNDLIAYLVLTAMTPRDDSLILRHGTVAPRNDQTTPDDTITRDNQMMQCTVLTSENTAVTRDVQTTRHEETTKECVMTTTQDDMKTTRKGTTATRNHKTAPVLVDSLYTLLERIICLKVCVSFKTLFCLAGAKSDFFNSQCAPDSAFFDINVENRNAIQHLPTEQISRLLLLAGRCYRNTNLEWNQRKDALLCILNAALDSNIQENLCHTVTTTLLGLDTSTIGIIPVPITMTISESMDESMDKSMDDPTDGPMAHPMVNPTAGPMTVLDDYQEKTRFIDAALSVTRSPERRWSLLRLFPRGTEAWRIVRRKFALVGFFALDQSDASSRKDRRKSEHVKSGIKTGPSQEAAAVAGPYDGILRLEKICDELRQWLQIYDWGPAVEYSALGARICMLDKYLRVTRERESERGQHALRDIVSVLNEIHGRIIDQKAISLSQMEVGPTAVLIWSLLSIPLLAMSLMLISMLVSILTYALIYVLFSID